jgi:hypothetical protein
MDVTIRQLVDQEHSLLLNQSYCPYKLVRKKDHEKINELRSVLRNFTRRKQKKLQAKLWE